MKRKLRLLPAFPTRKEITRAHQRENLDFLQTLNKRHAAERPGQDKLAARMESYELAFKMQMRVPGILDLSKESKQTLDAYGVPT